ncbi:MAG: hypothetical protein AB1744_15605, partial [Candidatus Zixiibacteriota bacterium]
ANLPCDACDTCSGGPCISFGSWDNDVYCQISTDYGATFNNKVNATKNVDGVAGHRPYTDLSALWASDGDLHIVYNARVWPADANQGGDAGSLRNRIFHLSVDPVTNLPGPISTAHNSEFDQEYCTGGAFALQSAKMTVSECNNKLYVLFTQFNDPKIGMNDCASDLSSGYPGGAANGELYITVSDNWGITWDESRNITNTHSPGCSDDPDTLVGLPCESENWSSMTRVGSNFAGSFPSDAILDEVELGGQAGEHQGYYLDAQFIGDLSAGGIVQGEGFWRRNHVRWFRIPCLEPIRSAQLYVSPSKIDYPSWSPPGVQLDTPLVVENGGNDSLNYSITVEEDIVSGWLDVNPTSGGIAPGVVNKDTLTITI